MPPTSMTCMPRTVPTANSLQLRPPLLLLHLLRALLLLQLLPY